MAQRRERTEEPPLACVTATGAQQIVPLRHAEEQPLQSPSVVPPAARLFAGGLREQETRDCKGIKISLGMSLQRGPLTRPEVFWYLKLGHVSFLPSLFFAVPVSSTIGLPLRWIFFTFHLYRRSFAELGSSCAWPLPHEGCFSQVKSESRHHRCHTSVCFSVLCLVTTKIWSNGH